MKKLIFLFLSVSFFANYPEAQKKDSKLQKKLEEMVRGFNGIIGLYVKNINSEKIAAINADTIFPTASMIKIPILVAVIDKIEKGDLTYHQQLEYKDSLLYAGEDILGSYKSGEKVDLRKVLMLMLTTSDNTASLWLQSLAGTGIRINQILDSWVLRIHG